MIEDGTGYHPSLYLYIWVWEQLLLPSNSATTSESTFLWEANRGYPRGRVAGPESRPALPLARSWLQDKGSLEAQGQVGVSGAQAKTLRQGGCSGDIDNAWLFARDSQRTWLARCKKQGMTPRLTTNSKDLLARQRQ